MTDAVLAQLVCPIGVAGISGKKPAEIAVSVAAEILRIRERRVADVSDGLPDNVRRMRR